MKRNADVVIVGGGVIGLTTAYFLARDGAEVILCDQGKLGMESSWAGAGILPPCDFEGAQLPLDRLRGLSGQIFPDFSRELQELTGIDNGFRRCGGLVILSQASAADAHEWHGLGSETEVLSEAEAHRLEPALAPGLGQVLHIPGMAQLRNPRHLQALRSACLKTNKVSFLEDAPAEKVVVAGSRAREVHTADDVLAANAFLVAAGAWTDRLLEPLGCRLDVAPVRGQIALLHPGALLFQRIVALGAQYLVPRPDGRVLIGSTEEHAGFEKNPTAQGIHGLLALGLRLVPRLAEAVLERSWAGLRPGSPDGLPFLGPVPGIDNLHVAAGHFRAGIQLSTGTAQLMKESILGKPLTMPLDAFRLGRPK